MYPKQVQEEIGSTQLNMFGGVSIEQILRAVCTVLDCPLELMFKRGKGERSCQNVAMVKQLVCYFWGTYKPCHYRQVIRLLRYSNHTAIIKNVKVTKKILTVDKVLQEQIEEIKQILNQ